jgi:hypothetical protein
MCLAFACAYACGAGYGLGALKYTLANFPEVRGMVASFLKPMDGLCAALYTQLHLCLAPTVSGFLLLQATLPPSVALLSLPFLRLFRDTEDSEMERAATVRTFEAAAVLTAALALYLLALSAIESVAAAHARVDDTGVMFGLMCVLVAAFGALPAAHAAWRAKEGPAVGGAGGADAESGERTPLGGGASPGGGGGGGYGATAAGAGAGGAAARELGHMPPRGATAAEASAVDDLSCPALICCAPVRPSTHHHGGGHHHGGHIGTSGDASNGAGQGYGSSDDEGAQLAAHANEADAGADGGGGDGEEEVFGAAKYYAGGSATVRDALGTADYWLTVGIMFLNNAVAYSLLKYVIALIAFIRRSLLR